MSYCLISIPQIPANFFNSLNIAPWIIAAIILVICFYDRVLKEWLFYWGDKKRKNLEFFQEAMNNNVISEKLRKLIKDRVEELYFSMVIKSSVYDNGIVNVLLKMQDDLQLSLSELKTTKFYVLIIKKNKFRIWWDYFFVMSGLYLFGFIYVCTQLRIRHSLLSQGVLVFFAGLFFLLFIHLIARFILWTQLYFSYGIGGYLKKVNNGDISILSNKNEV